MSDYDYGNARLHGKKSHLLTKRELDALAETGSIQELISALVRTAYRKSIEAALARSSGMDCITYAIRDDLVNTFGKVRNYFTGQAFEMATIIFRSYDIQNIKVILRGLSKQALAAEILAILLPIGELKADILTELAVCSSPRAAIDRLASQGSHFARPLIQLRSEVPGVGIPEMELALDGWFFQESFQYLQDEKRKGKLLFSAMQLEADIINLLTVLRFAHSPKDRKFLREWLQTDELDQLFVGPGKIPFAMLTSAGNQDQVSAAVDILANTPYKIPLNNGLKAYTQSILLSDIEKQLKHFQLTWMSRQVYKDPLGIGVLLGYVALKVNEISNIRWIAQGINLHLQADSIRNGLEYPG